MLKRLIMAALLLPFLTGCSSFWMAGNHEKTREGASSSLVDFLYPKGEVPPELPASRLQALTSKLHSCSASVTAPKARAPWRVRC